MLNFPEASVLVERENPLTGLRISTVALGTTAPDGSGTVPVTEVELPADCAARVGPIRTETARKNKKRANTRIEVITPLLQRDQSRLKKMFRNRCFLNRRWRTDVQRGDQQKGFRRGRLAKRQSRADKDGDRVVSRPGQRGGMRHRTNRTLVIRGIRFCRVDVIGLRDSSKQNQHHTEQR